MSVREFGQALNLSTGSAQRILNGGTIRLSLFLKIAEEQHLKIDVQPVFGNRVDDIADCNVN